MSVSQYNRIFNLSLVIVVLYNILCLADIFLPSLGLGGIIKASAIIYVLYAVGMVLYKIHIARRFFIGSSIPNIVSHLVLTVVSVVLILVSVF